MADNYLYAQRSDPFSSFMQGFQGGQGIVTNISRNSLLQEEAQRAKILTAMKLHDEMKGMTYDNLDFYNQTYRPALLKLGVPEGFLPQVDSVDKLNNLLYKNEQIKALYKQKMEGPKVVPPMGSVYNPMQGNFLYPQSPAFQAQLQQRQAEELGKGERQQAGFGFGKEIEGIRQQNRLDLIKERAEKAPREFAPQMVETDEGMAFAYPDGRVVPIKGATGKAKAMSIAELNKVASTNATKELSGNANYLSLDPSSPEAMKMYDATVEKHKRALLGTKKQSQSNLPELGTRKYKGKTYKIIMQNGVQGIDLDNPMD